MILNYLILNGQAASKPTTIEFSTSELLKDKHRMQTLTKNLVFSSKFSSIRHESKALQEEKKELKIKQYLGGDCAICRKAYAQINILNKLNHLNFKDLFSYTFKKFFKRSNIHMDTMYLKRGFFVYCLIQILFLLAYILIISLILLADLNMAPMLIFLLISFKFYIFFNSENKMLIISFIKVIFEVISIMSLAQGFSTNNTLSLIWLFLITIILVQILENLIYFNPYIEHSFLFLLVQIIIFYIIAIYMLHQQKT
jgi:hypothetical protein